MKVSIIVGGRFHAFNLAEELNKNGILKQIITSYPKFNVTKNFNIDRNKIKSLPLKELISRSPFNRIFGLDDKITDYFDKKASSLIDLKDLDILVGWSSFSLNSFLKAKNSKCLKILERGSTHIQYQKDILEKEYSIHGIEPKIPSDHIVDKEKQEYDLADYIFVPTEFVKQTFVDNGIDKNKIIKIPYGVNLDEFKQINNKDINYENKNKIFRIIFVGNSSVRKGIIYLIKSFLELNLENSELLIVGGIDKDIKNIMDSYFKNKKIKYFKPQKQNQLYKLYNQSNLFVTCSIEEGLAMVQLQAMSCGLPIICTINSGGEEIIDNNKDGYILPIRNTEELKKKILYLYNNRSICLEMGQKAQNKIKADFSWESYGKNVISTYQNLLNK
jgi:glycosyltransferase involved in cell wall biosynthesis